MKDAVLIGACALAVIILLVIAGKIRRQYQKKQILSLIGPGIDGAVRLLKLEFGAKNVLRGIYLPVYDGRRVVSYIFADTVILLPTCIAICRIRGEAGLIYCEDGFDWHQSARLRSGGTLETDFSNPMKPNKEAVSALRRIFDKVQVEEPDIHGVIMFASKTARFSCPQPNVYNLEHGYAYLKELAKGKHIPRDTRSTYRKLILSQTVKKSVAEWYNVKKLK